MSNMELPELIADVQKGNLKAFEKLYNETYDTVCSMVSASLDKEELLAQGVEKSYVAFIASIGRYNGKDSFDDYFKKIAERECADLTPSDNSSKKKVTKKDTYKSILASNECRVQFKLSKSKVKMATIGKVPKIIAVVFVSLVVMGAMVSSLVFNNKTVDHVDTNFEETTLPGVTQVQPEVQAETLFGNLYITTPDGEFIYYSCNGAVNKMGADGSQSIIIQKDSATSLLIENGKLYYIADGKLKCFNVDDNQLVFENDIKGNLLCYNNGFYVIDTAKQKVYSLDENYKIKDTATIKTKRIKYQDKYIYYYDENSNLVRQEVSMPLGKPQLLISGKKNMGMRMGYQISGGKCYSLNFDSDETGIISISDITNGASKKIKIDRPIVDFAVCTNDIICSTYSSGTYLAGLDGKCKKILYNTCLYYVGASNEYSAFDDVVKNVTLIYSHSDKKFTYVVNGNVDFFEIYNGYIFYDIDGKVSAQSLANIKYNPKK